QIGVRIGGIEPFSGLEQHVTAADVGQVHSVNHGSPTGGALFRNNDAAQTPACLTSMPMRRKASFSPSESVARVVTPPRSILRLVNARAISGRMPVRIASAPISPIARTIWIR